jgi:catalase-peroxidase
MEEFPKEYLMLSSKTSLTWSSPTPKTSSLLMLSQSTVGSNYGPFMIRLAWHCSGSYRESDGRGGCDGGRIRYDPELNWDDNANLNLALELLKPVKDKFGSKLSWGDLIILSGNAAIESMGGPILGFCGGRIDNADGSESLVLGPSDEQEAIAPCLSVSRQGECNAVEGSPIRPTTVGLIYVNPAGPVGSEGDPIASAADVRKAFANMGFNDTESVSLIGGGHAFGKCHGACDDPPCGRGTDLEGIGNNTFTSGFEGQWTTRPTTWTNEYFNNLFDFTWTLITGPGGNIQWEPSNADGSAGPGIMMLTTDIALAKDEAYKAISEKYASDISALETDFMHSWYRLTTGDMGPVSRCIGDNIPPAQNFQSPLPAAAATKPDYVGVRTQIQNLLDADEANTAAFVNLAYQCASTYRATDYKGGCNGARIRFSPEADWEANTGTAEALETLGPIKEEFKDVSMSDIIVLAGQAAIEGSGGNSMAFCGGRVDATDAADSEILAPRTYEITLVSIRDDMQVKGLSARQGVALAGRSTLSNQFYKYLLAGNGDFADEELALLEDLAGRSTLSNQFYKYLLAGNGDFADEELALLEDDFKAIVEEYAENEDSFKSEFTAAWAYMMNADRFMGPYENACTGIDDPTTSQSTSEDSSAVSSMAAKTTGVLVSAAAAAGFLF